MIETMMDATEVDGVGELGTTMETRMGTGARLSGKFWEEPVKQNFTQVIGSFEGVKR